MLTGSYNWDKSDATYLNAMSEVGRISPEAGTAGLASKKHTIGAKLTGVFSPTMVNEVNFGYSFSEASQDLPQTSQDFSNLASLSGRKYLGEINAPNVGNEVVGADQPPSKRDWPIGHGVPRLVAGDQRTSNEQDHSHEGE